MPIYDYRCNDCGSDSREIRKIAERNGPSTCSSCGGSHVYIKVGAPALMTNGTGGILSKTDDGWKDTLKTIKKNNPLGNIDV
jgi:putative FmdB family regulatory protein